MLAGTSKAGTTSVAAVLSGHPAVVTQHLPLQLDVGDKHVEDEVHIFDRHLRSVESMADLQWLTTPELPERDAGKVMQLHYTANYMYFPDAPFNIVKVYPNAHAIKYLFMVREPAARAASAWRFHRQVTLDLRSFDKVVHDGVAQRRALEDCYEEALRRSGNSTARHVEDLPPPQQKAIVDACFWGRPGTHDMTTPPETMLTLMHAHVDKGIYVDQLRRWFSLVGRENCLVFSLEEWAADESAVFSRIADFVGLQVLGRRGYANATKLDELLHKQWNDEDGFSTLIPKPPMPAESLVGELTAFYRPYNEALFELLGRRLY